MEDLGVSSQAIFALDGEEALLQAKKLIRKAWLDENYTRCPVKLMLLDY